MLQIVHDLAPQREARLRHRLRRRRLAFAEEHRRPGRPVSEGGAGAEVIVDDVGYFEEPFFQDGPVAVAVDKVTAEGVTYLSAAGNDNLFDGEGNEIASWEAPEYPRLRRLPGGSRRRCSGFNGTHCMDFNPGAATDRTFGIKVEPGRNAHRRPAVGGTVERRRHRPRRLPAQRQRRSC